MTMKLVRLGDVCEVVSGSTPKSNIPEYWDGEIKWITPAELNDDSYVVYDSVRHIADLGVQKTGLKPFPAGTVILSSRAPIGKTAIAGCEMYCNQGFKNLICSEVIDNRYLYHYLSAKTEYLNSLGRGATFKEISKSIVENIEIPLPSLEEQRKLADQFEQIKQLISLRKMQIYKLDQLVKSRFIELFGDPVTNERGWHVKPLLEMGSCKNGMNFHYEDNGVEINCLGVGDFKDHTTINDTSLLPTVSLNEMPYDEYLLKDDDIVFVRSNGNKSLVGRSVAVYPGLVPTIFSGFCIRFRKTDDTIVIPYLLQVLKAESIRQKMVGRGANIQNLNQQILGTLVIPVPPIILQNQFAEFIKQVDKSKFDLMQSLEKLETLKKSLMQQYFG